MQAVYRMNADSSRNDGKECCRQAADISSLHSSMTCCRSVWIDFVKWTAEAVICRNHFNFDVRWWVIDDYTTVEQLNWFSGCWKLELFNGSRSCPFIELQQWRINPAIIFIRQGCKEALVENINVYINKLGLCYCLTDVVLLLIFIL